MFNSIKMIVLCLILLVVARSIQLYIMLVGVFLNTVAIVSNGGKMPVKCIRSEETYKHKPMNQHTRFKSLCDIIPVTFFNRLVMASVGDFLIFCSFLYCCISPS